MNGWKLGVTGLALGLAAGAAVTFLLVRPADNSQTPQPQLGKTRDAASRKENPSSTPKPVPKLPAPFLHIVAPRRHSFRHSDGLSWHLDGFRVRELTVRLEVIRAGKAHRAGESTCRWEDWQWDRGEERASGELVYLFQAGTRDGNIPGQGVPVLSIVFGEQPEYTGPEKQTRHDAVTVALDGGVRWTGSTKTVPGKETILYAAIASPATSVTKEDGTVVTKGGHSFPERMTKKWLLDASRQGSTVVAVFLVWKAQ
jgi:hypothetical protein